MKALLHAAATWCVAAAGAHAVPPSRPPAVAPPRVSHHALVVERDGRNGLLVARLDAARPDTLLDVITCQADSVRLFGTKRPGRPDRQLAEAPLRPGEPLYLSPTGARARVFGLTRVFRAGDSLEVVFSYARAGLVRQWVRVVSKPASASQAVASRPPDVADVSMRFLAGVRSPFCEDALLRDCPTPEAAELREKITRELARGATPAAVRAWLRHRYGDAVVLQTD